MSSPSLSNEEPDIASAPLAPKEGARVRVDRWFWLAILISACVVIPRSALIARAHSEYVDDQAHLRRGLTLLSRNSADASIMLTDPPAGAAIMVLPMWLAGCRLSDPITPEHWP